MGGWYLQPDCNMPSGESFVRQMLLGRHYFQEKFGVTPTTAINFDPFGHTRGLIQVMKKAGFTSYMFCRPEVEYLTLANEDFIWVGYDGSEIIGHRAIEFYNSPRGKADEKVMDWMEKNQDKAVGSLLWGVGNHGGGPSLVDLDKLKQLMVVTEEPIIIHSTPEAYFQELIESGEVLPRHVQDVSRLKARAFFALASGQNKAEEGDIPILVYNPHPYKVEGIFECEFQLPDQNWNEEFSLPVVYSNGVRIASQAEQELSNLNLDWRKRAVFRAELAPGQMNRFDCKLEVLPRKPKPELQAVDGKIIFVGEDLEIIINCETGLMDQYRIRGVDHLWPESLKPLVIEDNDDSWATLTDRFRNVIGSFTLMANREGTRFSGVKDGVLESVRIIEEGAVRTVVEALFEYGDSYLIQTYKLPKKGTEIEVNIRVHWNEKSKMLKLAIPTVMKDGVYWGQVAYGRDVLPDVGREAVAQKWTAVHDKSSDMVVTCVNDGLYGSDYADGELRLTLMRSPAYSGLPIKDRPIMPQDRYSSRMDQGERLFRFWLNAGKGTDCLATIDREALTKNEKPFVLSFFPSGAGLKPETGVTLSDPAVLLTAFKKAERSDDYIIRLFEPTGVERRTMIHLPIVGIQQDIMLGKFEIKTLRLNTVSQTLTEAALMEMD
jgi:alpha-mannosidase